MKRKLSEEYDGRLGYRFMEAARNYMQHRGSIVHLIGFRGVSDAAGNLVRNVVVVAAKLSRLIEDPKFKRAVVEELRKRRKGLVPITPLVRDYVEGLGAVQEALREMIGSDVRDWEQLLGAVLQRGREHFGQSGGAVAIVALSDGKGVESQQLFPELWNYRAALSQKNSLLANLTKRYVSSAHAQPDEFNPPGEKDA